MDGRCCWRMTEELREGTYPLRMFLLLVFVIDEDVLESCLVDKMRKMASELEAMLVKT